MAREDLLEEAARTTAQHLPAGEHGNTEEYYLDDGPDFIVIG